MISPDAELTQTHLKFTPVTVSGLSSGVASITAGFYHTCAVTTGGTAWSIALEIRLYRCALLRKAAVGRVWRALEGGRPAG